MPNAFALSDDHVNFLLLRYVMFVSFKVPARKTLHLDEFNLRPEMMLKLSNVFIRVSKDFFVPSIIKVASSAKGVFFTSLLFIEIPVISLLLTIENDNNSIHIMNK